MNRFLVLSRGFASSPVIMNSIKSVTIVGGGLMGNGIAQVSAQAGHSVYLVDLNPQILENAQKTIEQNLNRVGRKLYKDNTDEIPKFVKDVTSRIKVTTDIKEALNVDLVLEAIVENLEMKHKLFASIDALAPETTLFATNTSSIPITEIGSVIKRKDRFGGLHFFNPVPVMRLLEVIRSKDTSEETYKSFIEWGKAIGKTCITCKDTPGFVVNRLLAPLSTEAIRLVERGDATARDVDIGMKLGAGYPMGPFELLDFTGLDTNKSAVETMRRYDPENPLFQPIPLLDKLVSEGKLGVKTGEGFYKYEKKQK